MDYFAQSGAHVLVDGQFGSTGKGVLAAYLAAEAIAQGAFFHLVVSNAGPNSGHTFYHGDEKHVLKQLPTFAVASHLLGRTIPVFLSAGAIIDPQILCDEARRYPGIPIFVHPMAAVITDAKKDVEKVGSIAAVAGTRSGTGAALAAKVNREPDAVIDELEAVWPNNVNIEDLTPTVQDMMRGSRVFVEVSQGFSLGLNSQFYPKVTSRECTVMQAIADARIAPKFVTKTYMVARTYPIRVGNVDGHSSGDHYPDQQEITWEALGVLPELTTVTKRERRVFTFSNTQMLEAVQANQPDIIFMNFMNYLGVDGRERMERTMEMISITSGVDYRMIYGFGPKSDDVVPF